MHAWEHDAYLLWRNERGLDPEERHRRKVITHAAIYGASKDRLNEIMREAAPRKFEWKVPKNINLPIFPRLHKSFGLGFLISPELLEDDAMFRDSQLPMHLRRLDDGDRLAMKQMKMDEQEYRVFLFDIEEAERKEIAGQIRGRYEDGGQDYPGKVFRSIDMAAAEEGAISMLGQSPPCQPLAAVDGPSRSRIMEKFNSIAQPGGFAKAMQNQLNGPSTMPAPPRIDLLDQAAAGIAEQRQMVGKAFEYMNDRRNVVLNSHPLGGEYHSNLMHYHESVMEYVICVRRYMNEASISLGIVPLAQAAGQG